MHLTQTDRRIHHAYEAQRELAEVGPSAEVTCHQCDVEVRDDDGDLVVLAGEVFCPTCALSACARLFLDAIAWAALKPADRIDVLETFSEAAGKLESDARAELRRKAVQ